MGSEVDLKNDIFDECFSDAVGGVGVGGGG